MTDIDALRSKYEKAEQAAQKIMADRDEALLKLRDRFDQKLIDANQAAVDAQRLLLDSEVQASLEGRPDRDEVVARLRAEAEQHLTGSLAIRNTRPDGSLDVETYEAGVQALKDRAAELGFDHLPFAAPAE